MSRLTLQQVNMVQNRLRARFLHEILWKIIPLCRAKAYFSKKKSYRSWSIRSKFFTWILYADIAIFRDFCRGILKIPIYFQISKKRSHSMRPFIKIKDKIKWIRTNKRTERRTSFDLLRKWPWNNRYNKRRFGCYIHPHQSTQAVPRVT